MEQGAENTGKKTTRIRSNNPLINELGRIPPQNTEMEQAVLGAMMLSADAVNAVIDKLKENSFYDPKNQFIFRAIFKLFQENKPIDLLTVIQKLTQSGELEAAGGMPYISELTARVGSAAHIEYHAKIISEKAIKRELIRVSSEILKNAYDETIDVFDTMNEAEKALFEISENNLGKNASDMLSIVSEAVKEIQEAAKNKDGVSGVPTGFHKLDQLTAGWQRSDLIILAARPAMGKTAFVLSMARNTAVDYNMGVAVFSLEMSSVQLVKRLISSETRIQAEKLRKGNLTDYEMDQLHKRIKKLSTAPIYIDDTPGISVFDLRAKCRRLKAQHNIQLVIIDYLQLMTAGGAKGAGNREQEISTISRSLKEIAKELNVPVIALSQLSRSVETRGGDKRPMLSDLRESGAIEQDADIVSFIYRPEYYGFTQNENNESNAGVGEIIIAKHRNGGLDTVRLQFIGEYARFENPEQSAYESAIQMRQLENDVPKTYTVKSNMNDISDLDDFNFVGGQEDDQPF